MGRLRSPILSAALLLVIVAVCGTPALAQDPPDQAEGMSPSATYHGGTFDFVDMATGRLHIHIPLLEDHSQRGQLNFTYSLTYTSTGAFSMDAVGHRQLPKYGWGTPWLITDGALDSSGGEEYTDTYCQPACHYYAYSVREADGSSHPLGSAASSWESIDGSGIQVGSVFSPSAAITTKGGIRFCSTCGPDNTLMIEDTNGNRMEYLFGFAAATDTLGRTWTTTAGSSDVTGCPLGGPVAPTTSTIWTVPGPAGTRTYKLCYSTYTISIPIPLGPWSCYASLVSGVVLPDGTTWRFDYANNSWGDLVAVYPPTGGSISYSWATVTYLSAIGGTDYLRVPTRRIVNDGTNSYTWKYIIVPLGAGFASTNTMTDPLGNDTVYTQSEGVTQKIQRYAGSSTSGTLVQTITKAYTFLPDPFPGDFFIYNVPPLALLTGTTTQWSDGQQNQISLSYDSGFTFTDNNTRQKFSTVYGLITSQSQSDYGSGAPGGVLSTTSTTYVALSNAPNAGSYLSANILDLPSKVVVTDGSPTPNVCAETDYGYDEYTLDASSVSEQHVAAPNSVMGNQTSITRQYFGNPCATPTPSETPYKTVAHFYDTGMKHTVTDPNNNTTTYAYSPTFYGAYVTQTTFPTTSSPNPANHVISGNYDFNSGLLTSFTDENNNTTNYTYDVMLRPISVTYPSPDGGQTVFNYPNTTTVEMKKQIDATRWTDSLIYYDGLGRESRRMSVTCSPKSAQS